MKDIENSGEININKKLSGETTWKTYSTRNILSYNLMWMATVLMGSLISMKLVFFYEVEVGLPIFLYSLAFTIFSVWDAINDPFMGFLSDRPNRLWKKWGKRFPWIVFSLIPVVISFFLVFIPPDPSINVWATFFWFLIIISIYDAFVSLRSTNYNALFPDKFRSASQRTKVSGISMAIQTVAIFSGFILPPLLIIYGDPNSYVIAALVIIIISVIFALLTFPGVREDKEMIQRAIILAKEPRDSFFKIMKSAYKHKNFRIWLIKNLFVAVFDNLLIASIPYYTYYILNVSAEAEIFLYLPFLLIGVLTVPLWMKLGKKYGYLKIFIFGMFFVPTCLIPLLFIDNLFQAIIVLAFIGAAIGSHNVMQGPIMGALFDEAAVINQKRLEGSYMGIQTFVAKLSAIIQVLTIAIAHTVTGFDPSPGATQTPLALFGIRVHMALVPMIFFYIGAIIFAYWWDLKPEKYEGIQEKLKELGI